MLREKNLSSLIAQRLLSRLPVFRLQPQTILTINVNTIIVQQLAQRYPQAVIHSVSASEFSLQQMQAEDIQVDMIFFNLISIHEQKLFTEFRQILAAHGLLLFTILGKDSFKELAENFNFVDMHDVGDCLLRNQFIDPVMDVEFLTLQYASYEKVCEDMQDLGIHLIRQNVGNIPQKIAVTLELIYGQAVGNAEVRSFLNEEGEIVVPLKSLLDSRGSL